MSRTPSLAVNMMISVHFHSTKPPNNLGIITFSTIASN